MDLSVPARALVPGAGAAVIRVLAGTTAPLTGREIARLSGSSPATVLRVLARMTESGLVHRSEAGPAHLYVLNHDHVAAPIVLALRDLRLELFRRIAQRLASWERPPVAAAIYGSAARGDGDSQSDVDVLLIRPADLDLDDGTWTQGLADLAGAIGSWSGNPGSVVDLTRAQMAAMIDREDELVTELRRDAVMLTDRSVLDTTDEVDR